MKLRKVQQDALDVWLSVRKGTLSMCTGSGKSRIFVEILKTKPYKNVLLVVPTEKLRDSNWKEEFEKWDAEKLYDSLDRCCYASINKKTLSDYDLICLDESHNITNNRIEQLSEYKGDILSLTATFPSKEHDEEKHSLLSSIAPEIFKYTLEQGVEEGVVAPYNITVYYIPLTLAA